MVFQRRITIRIARDRDDRFAATEGPYQNIGARIEDDYVITANALARSAMWKR